jgi:hypothetical protein
MSPDLRSRRKNARATGRIAGCAAAMRGDRTIAAAYSVRGKPCGAPTRIFLRMRHLCPSQRRKIRCAGGSIAGLDPIFLRMRQLYPS